jgi:hypothetical protein
MTSTPRSLTCLASLVASGTLVLAACSGDDPASEDTSGTETAGDGDGDPSGDGDGDGDPSGDGDGDELVEPDPEVAWPTLDCDPLVPDYCMFPFPSNVFTAADPATPTGLRVALTSAALPAHKNGSLIDPSPYNLADGFSPAQAPMTYLPGATATGLPSWTDLAASLEPDCPTVVLDAETGERVAHFAELDISHAGPTPAFMIRPVTKLKTGHRYIVAIRGVVDSSGDVLTASPGFAALRDLSPSDDPDVEVRRPLYADIFARLGAAGVERESLQIAWDFTTASEQHITRDLLHMRDTALALYGEDEGPDFTIDVVDTDFHPETIAYRLEGTIEVPLFLDSPAAGGRLVRGDDGLPVIDGYANYRWIAMIPQSALQSPAGLLQHGHGLLGSATQVQGGDRREFANQYNYITFALDWIGMSNSDTANIIEILGQGNAEDFVDVSDRLRQGIVNFELGMRMMRTSFANDPVFGQYVDPSSRQYLGISQGGIFGGTFMAISTEIERGVLGVPGQPYNLLLNRSVDFDVYLTLLQFGYDDGRDIQMFLALTQMLWDHAEPTGYTHRIESDPFPGTPAHQVLIRAAVGDHQVTTLGAHIMARAVGAKHLDTGVRELWGLDAVSGSNDSSTYVEYAFGLPEDPIGNVPQTACDDPHGKIGGHPAAMQQAAEFFATGVIANTCEGGVCSFPELSGCN